MKTRPLKTMSINNFSKDIAVECKNLSKFYYTSNREKVYALNNVSLSFPSGSFTVVAGANGEGKTTLLYIIASLLKQSDGECKVFSSAGLVLQDSISSILGDTPFDDVAFSLRKKKFEKKEREEKIIALLEKVGLSDKMYHPSFSLSGGEKKRLSIASILALDTKILLLDEPYSNLDYEGVVSVNRILKTLLRENVTIVVVTHEIEKCLALSSKFVVLKKGEVVFDGTPEEGLLQNLEEFGIKNPLLSYNSLSSLVWI